MVDVFLSYKREERARCVEINKALKALLLDVWFDADCTLGTSFDKEIERKLSEARAVLVLWSLLAVDSDWVREEARTAYAGHCLVSVKLEPCRLPLGLGGVQTVELVSVSDGDEVWQRVLDRIGQLVGRPGLSEFARCRALDHSDSWQGWIRDYPDDPLRPIATAALARIHGQVPADKPRPVEPRAADALRSGNTAATPRNPSAHWAAASVPPAFYAKAFAWFRERFHAMPARSYGTIAMAVATATILVLLASEMLRRAAVVLPPVSHDDGLSNAAIESIPVPQPSPTTGGLSAAAAKLISRTSQAPKNGQDKVIVISTATRSWVSSPGYDPLLCLRSVEISFESRSAALSPSARDALTGVVERLGSSCKNVVTEIDGHGDSGEPAEVAKQRVQAVRNVLLRGALHYAPDSIDARSYGSSRPKAGTLPSAAENRRVEIIVKHSQLPSQVKYAQAPPL